MRPRVLDNGGKREKSEEQASQESELLLIDQLFNLEQFLYLLWSQFLCW